MSPALAQNVWENCRQAVAARLTALGFLRPDGTPLPVVRQLFATEAAAGSMPALLVSLDGPPPARPRAVAFGFSERNWPVTASLHHRGDPAATDRNAAWYESTVQGIVGAFDSAPTFATAGTVFRVDCEPLDLQKARRQWQSVVAGVVLRCVSTEPLAGVPLGG